ncbi:ATPase component of ABC transporter [Labilithrix luteola]|uniref:ATPase component of ABC transporter n=1 Tax=Labilithrix luteola TaxID=1391654 RepID=A0A0K1QB15_9BACT|nr:ABC-F family ATP-binding cassette domain-containing protein [Labilithrix luteola]AKV02857.1 ATPase component of ABC transporter [Labilithrix luteola]
MSVIAALEVTKAYGDRILLSSASVTIDDGERVGVVGRNGAGKSTFAKILAGAEPADGGSIALRRGARVAYLAQEPAIEPSRTVRAHVEEGLDAWLVARKRHDELTERISQEPTNAALLAEQHAASAEVERLGGWDRTHEVERVLAHLGVGEVIDRPAGSLSGGQKRRVALARVLVGAPDVMILDEPTNHLDADTIDWLEKYLVDEFRGAVLLVTHDRWLLDRVADRTLEVESGNVHSYDGGYADYLGAKAERMALQQRTEKNRQNFLRTELEWLARQPKARTGKQKARIQRAETARDTTGPREEARVSLSAQVADGGRSVLDLRGLGIKMGDRWLVRGLDLNMTAGDRLGILGPNGAGKTTLLRAVQGVLTPTEGEVVLGRRVRIGYLDQNREALDPNHSVLEAVSEAIPVVEKERVDPRTYLERFAFEGNAQKKKVAALSGGERARLALARLLASSCNLLLLDEPSNDLDTDTLSALEDFLSTYEGSLLVVTHDRYLLDRVTTGILSFEKDGRVTRYAGAYQAYATARARQEEERKADKAKESAREKDTRRTEKKASGLSKNEQRELDGIMDKIDEAETKAAAIEAELGDPSLYAGGQEDSRASEIRTRLADARALAAKLTARWEELEAKKSAAG